MKTLVIIPAAGLATRMQPLSATMSKTMIPVCGKPILARILKKLEKISCDIVIVGGDIPDIKNYIESRYHQNVFYTTQDKKFDGPLGAIYSGISYYKTNNMKADNVVVWLGDTLINSEEAINNFFNTPLEQNIHLGVAEVPDWSRWCMIDENGFMYDKQIEQPPTNKTLIGLYRFDNNTDAFYNICLTLVGNNQTEIAPLIEWFKNMLNHNVILQHFTSSWHDCGDLPSLHKTESELMKENARGFNSIKIENGVVTKKSTNYSAEINWYNTIIDNNLSTKKLLPQIYSDNPANQEYEMEYCSGSTLQDLVVYHNINRKDVWENIINSVLSSYSTGFIEYYWTEHDTINQSIVLNDVVMFCDNIINRINQIDFIDEKEKQDLKNEITSWYEYHKSVIECYDAHSIIHGDFHFGNILYDASLNKTKVLDPRGKWGYIETAAGNILYDVAKWYQSILCGYCHIASDENIYETQEKLYKTLEEISDKKWSEALVESELNIAKQFAKYLLLSAIPCHSDNPDRQKRMYSIAKRLINEQRQ